MTTTKIISLAILAALPFAAHATDPVVAVGPAHASSNPVVATAVAPYVTVTPSAADESHIATTAYVKGAYNDAIAAVNKVDSDKQNNLGLSGVMDAGDVVSRTMGVIVNNDNSALANTSDKAVSVYGLIGAIDEYNNYLTNDVVQAKLYNGDTDYQGISADVLGPSNMLGRIEEHTYGVLYSNSDPDMYLLDVRNNVADTPGDRRLTTADGVVISVLEGMVATKNYTDSKRVRIYTTWGTDTVAATTLVPFEMAQ